MRTTKKLMALNLVILLVIAMVPMAAFADTQESQNDPPVSDMAAFVDPELFVSEAANAFPDRDMLGKTTKANGESPFA